MTRDDIQEIAKIVADEIRASAIFNKWLTHAEAAKYAKVSGKTIQRWINMGLIYASRTTGSWRVDRESIDDFFNDEA